MKWPSFGAPVLAMALRPCSAILSSRCSAQLCRRGRFPHSAVVALRPQTRSQAPRIFAGREERMSKAMEEQDMDRGVRSRHQAASDFLFELWRTGRVADGLPHDIMPSSRREAYAVQALIEARSTRPRFGWK